MSLSLSLVCFGREIYRRHYCSFSPLWRTGPVTLRCHKFVKGRRHIWGHYRRSQGSTIYVRVSIHSGSIAGTRSLYPAVAESSSITPTHTLPHPTPTHNLVNSSDGEGLEKKDIYREKVGMELRQGEGWEATESEATIFPGAGEVVWECGKHEGWQRDASNRNTSTGTLVWDA